MTTDEIRERIGLIRAAAAGKPHASTGDAHQLRDELLLDVLEAIADGESYNTEELEDLARAALKVREVDMALWFE